MIPIKWTTEDAIALNTFLTQNPKVMMMIDALAPSISTHNETVEGMALKGARFAGYKDIVDNIARMRVEPFNVNTNPIE